MKSNRTFAIVLATLIVCLVTPAAFAAEPPAEAGSLEKAFKKDTFSPYGNRSFPSMVLWGDTHLHTALSMDAGAFGNRLMPEEAYRFARGEELTCTTGTKARLSRPLDWLFVADHSDNMGLFTLLFQGDPEMTKSAIGRELSEKIRAGGRQGVEAALYIILCAPTEPYFDLSWQLPDIEKAK